MSYLTTVLRGIGLALLALSAPASAEERYMIAGGRTVAVLDTFRECDACPDMVALPMGSFEMGSTAEEADAEYRLLFTNSNADPGVIDTIGNAFLTELPKHRVTIDQPIAMGRTEITRADWALCVAAGRCADEFDARIRFRLPNGPYQDDPRSPIAAITFLEMQDYVAWLNDIVGTTAYRLPTEAEWEYAARAGTLTTYPQGDTLLRDHANFHVAWIETVNGEPVWHNDPANERRPISVDRLEAANAWGLRHMAGNVIEMTRTCYADRHAGFASSGRYLAATFQPLGCERVSKGGAHVTRAEGNRPERRTRLPEHYWGPWVGFRIVRQMQPAPLQPD